MKGFLLITGIALFCLTGCAPTCRDTSLYQNTGRQKAIVAVLPVVDQSGSEPLPWDLSEELTGEIRARIDGARSLYLLQSGTSREIAALLTRPNLEEVSKASLKSLGAAEFAVVTEVIEADNPISCAYLSHGEDQLLSLAVRVRVIDLRQSQPKVILQEIVGRNFHLTWPDAHLDYSKMAWGTKAFTQTPMGIAHERLVKELVARAEAYIETVR